MKNNPIVSCIMPTYNRRKFIPRAIAYFLRQDYIHKELIILDDGEDRIHDLVPDHPDIRYYHEPKGRTLGAKRNRLCELARGDIIAHWDDDDWHAPHRLRYQVASLLAAKAQVCGIDHLLFYYPDAGRAWEYHYPQRQRFWLSGSSFCYRRDYWRSHPFPNIAVGEDSQFVWNGDRQDMLVLEDYKFHVGIIHSQNASPKHPGGSWWRPYDAGQVISLFGADAEFYTGTTGTAVLESAATQPRHALVAAAYGIGDIVRMTPLVRALARLGYSVDFLAAPDYAEMTVLIENAPEIRRFLHYPDFRITKGRQPLAGLGDQDYDVAIFSYWAAPLKQWVRSARTLVFSQKEWLRDGDYTLAQRVAAQLDWRGPLPDAFVLHSERNFNLPPGTVALHPGCKPEWPWKKWHGFEELAAGLSKVVIVGADADRDNAGTYFKKPFKWPAHVQDYTGQLSLADTTALINQCTALISNDSGVMHIGAALGIPTFGIFGITSPGRETIPQANVHPITKGLACEAACHAGGWGRRDCKHGLKCLKTLAADEVLEKVVAVTSTADRAGVASEEGAMNQISVTYYGYMFDASGYGQAARANVRALLAAGIKLRVVNLANRPRQVRDELVESLVRPPGDSDFHLFHGIPSEWGRLAFPRRNAVGITVWETDTMPSQWRNVLNHTLDVWLPCAFNVQAFGRALQTPVFQFPHPIVNNHHNDRIDRSAVNEWLGVREKDFVFYSIFEWQDRKNPTKLLEAFLRVFDDPEGPILVIKSNGGAARAAHRTLNDIRQRSSSRARIDIRCEAWSDDQIQALHGRGDCYVSLHSGEGWCYPLFDAASRGTPVVATKYSGPLDYLGKDYPGYVDYTLCRVRQPYAYYNKAMAWAAPDLEVAAARMRWVYENKTEARHSAEQTARKIRKDFSLEAVGQMAKQRLMQLLRRTQPERSARLRQLEQESLVPPAVPVPGDWYDADYFEHGLKSNWENGYHWQSFSGLFQETAQFLTEVFTEARSFLDIGCAKGFLVKTLRERDKECWGFDHSPWVIERAEEMARPFIKKAGVDEVHYDQRFDVLVALSIFESLTETQAFDFLRRAKSWTNLALIATISSCDGINDERNSGTADYDLSHITIKSRKWWHDLILRAGWQQDPLHRIVESMCQNHRLPLRMGWNVYVYSPT